MTKSTDDDEAVGFGHPPKATRFKKGSSGNPRGRPKRSRNIATELRAELDTKVTVKENGTMRTLSKSSALAKSIVARAVNGDMRAFDAILRILPERFVTIEEPKAQAELTVGEQAIVERLLTRRLNQAAAARPQNQTRNGGQSAATQDPSTPAKETSTHAPDIPRDRRDEEKNDE